MLNEVYSSKLSKVHAHRQAELPQSCQNVYFLQKSVKIQNSNKKYSNVEIS